MIDDRFVRLMVALTIFMLLFAASVFAMLLAALTRPAGMPDESQGMGYAARTSLQDKKHLRCSCGSGI
jgi:hypothetical protein